MTEPVDAVKTGWRAEVGDLGVFLWRNAKSMSECFAKSKSEAS